MNEMADWVSLATFLKLLGTVAALWFGYYTVNIFLVRRKYAHIPGPSSPGLIGFYFGQLFSMQKELKDRIFADLMLEWHLKYGKTIKIQIMNNFLVSTVNTDAIKEALIVKNYPRSPYVGKVIGFPFNQRFMGRGLVSDWDNDNWKAQRAIFNPGFHRNVLMNFVNHFNTKASILMERFRELADGKTVVKMFTEINHATLDAIAVIAFGMNIDTLNGKDLIFNEYISETLKIVNAIFFEPFFESNPLNWGKGRKIQKMLGYLRSVGRDKIMERINAYKNGDHDEALERNDILSGILKSAKDDHVDIESMVDNFLTFFVAGQETTANTLAFCFLELAKNPKIFDLCRKEVDEIIGSRSEITYEDVTKLKYIGCVFKEALRLYPPAPALTRVITDEMDIDGLKIPVGSSVNFSTYVCGRLEEYFPNCLEFKPERFQRDSNSMETGIMNYTYFPFSIGPRNCIGQNFAQIEGITIIAKFVQNLDLKLDPTQSMKLAQDLTVRPADGTRAILTPRV